MTNLLVHLETFLSFNSKKLSISKDDTQYTIGLDDSMVLTGTPDISYDSIVFIKDSGNIWTHGKLYNDSSDSLYDICNINSVSGYKVTPNKDVYVRIGSIVYTPINKWEISGESFAKIFEYYFRYVDEKMYYGYFVFDEEGNLLYIALYSLTDHHIYNTNLLETSNSTLEEYIDKLSANLQVIRQIAVINEQLKIQDTEYEYVHNLSTITYDRLANMQVGDAITAIMVNPRTDSGYVIGYDHGLQKIGNGFISREVLTLTVDLNCEDEKYQVTILKESDGYVEHHVTIENGTANFVPTTSQLPGYLVYRYELARRVGADATTVTISYSGKQPLTIYFMAYCNQTRTMTLTDSSNNVIASHTTASPSTLDGYSQYTLNGSETFKCNLTSANSAAYFYVVFPEVVEEPGDEFYSIEFNGGYYPNQVGTSVNWSTNVEKFQLDTVTAAINTNLAASELVSFKADSGDYFGANMLYTNAQNGYSQWILLEYNGLNVASEEINRASFRMRGLPLNVKVTDDPVDEEV